MRLGEGKEDARKEATGKEAQDVPPLMLSAMPALSLRPTIIAGEKLPNDYCVIHNSRSVGRIHKSDGLNGSTIWAWSINRPLPIPPWCNGSADGFEAAKDQFKAAWERFYASDA